MNSELNNPYAAPQAELQPSDSRKPLASRATLRAWLIVFMLNLPLPILFGIFICVGSGHAAMWVMVGLLLVFSSLLVVAKPWIGDRLIDGGVAVAMSQFLPVLHVVLAAGAFFFVEAVGLYTPPPPPPPPPPNYDYMDGGSSSERVVVQYSPAAMFFLTGFMGIGLMLFSFLLGLLPIFNRRSEIIENE